MNKHIKRKKMYLILDHFKSIICFPCLLKHHLFKHNPVTLIYCFRLVFSQSLLSLDLIELFLSYKDEEAEAEAEKAKKGQKVKYWKKDEDYLRMDGSTGAQSRSKFTANFNNAKNSR